MGLFRFMQVRDRLRCADLRVSDRGEGEQRMRRVVGDLWLGSMEGPGVVGGLVDGGFDDAGSGGGRADDMETGG